MKTRSGGGKQPLPSATLITDMELVIDGRSMAVTRPSGVPVMDIALVLGDTVPVRIRVDHALTDCTPALAVKQTIGSADLIMTVTDWTREDDWQTASWVINTVPLQTALGSADKVDLVAEVVLVAPNGAQHTSRPIRITVRRDILPAEYAPPAEVLADWHDLINAALAAQLPDALHDAGMYVTPAGGSTTLASDMSITHRRDVTYYRLPLNHRNIVGHLASTYTINSVTLKANVSSTPVHVEVYKLANGSYRLLGRSQEAIAIPNANYDNTWTYPPGLEVRHDDTIMLRLVKTDGADAVLALAITQVLASTPESGADIVDGLVDPQRVINPDYPDIRYLLYVRLGVSYTSGVSVGGVELATKDHFDALSQEVVSTGEQVHQDAQSSDTAREQAEEALRLANAAAAAAQAALAAMPQVDASGNMTLAGGVTASAGTINGPLVINNPAGKLGDGTHNQIYGVTWFHQQGEFRNGVIVRNGLWMESGTLNINSNASLSVNVASTFSRAINANGGVNISPSVSPLLTGAVSNNELLDYLVDRTMRMSPYVTTIPAITLKDYIDSDKSTTSPYVNLGMGMIGIKSWGVGVNQERHLRFKNNKSPFFADTQDGPMFYNGSVVVYSSPTLLSVSYLTSPGAMAQIGFFGNNGRQFGVRLVNKEGAAYYEMFYCTGADADEVIAVEEPKPDYVSLYSGSTQPKYKMQSLAIYCPSNQADYAIVKFGPWTMRVPFYIDPSFVLDLLVRDGTKSINYYGAGLSARIATITYICLGYTDQFVPDLNNNTYKS